MYYLPFLLLLYLTMSGNYIDTIIHCGMQDILNKSILLKHGIAFLTLAATIIYTSTEDPFYSILLSVGLYIIFLISIRTDISYVFVFGILLFILYVLFRRQVFLDKLNRKQNKLTTEYIQVLRNIVFYLSIVVLCIGFFVYLGRKSLEYKGKWNWKKYINVSMRCKFNSDTTADMSHLVLFQRGIQQLFGKV